MRKERKKSFPLKKVFSLNLICFLRCKGIKEKDIGFNEKTKKVYFVYEETDRLNELIEEYRDSDAVVRLHDFISEFKQLKEEMYRYSKEFSK